VPLKAKPGKMTIVFQRERSSCGAISSGVQALGWTFNSIPFKNTDATTLISAMKQALHTTTPTPCLSRALLRRSGPARYRPIRPPG
jgi:hypothetical protein